MARMKDFYKETVAPALFKKFGYKSVMQIGISLSRLWASGASE